MGDLSKLETENFLNELHNLLKGEVLRDFLKLVSLNNWLTVLYVVKCYGKIKTFLSDIDSNFIY